MPSFNHGVFIEKSINSVLSQTIADFELIIVDNFSNDNTDNVLKKFKDKRIKVFKFKNNGVIAASRNFGIKKSRGKLVAFIDSDDIWYKNKLEISLNFLNEGKTFIFHSMDKIFGNKIKKNSIRYSFDKIDIFKLLLKGNIIPTSSVILKKKILLDVNLFCEDKFLITSEDFELWLRILNDGHNAFLIPETLGCNREHSNNSSGNLKRIINAGIYAVKKTVNNLKLSPPKRKIIHKKSLAFLFYSYAMLSLKMNKPKEALKLIQISLKFDRLRLIYSLTALAAFVIMKVNFIKILK